MRLLLGTGALLVSSYTGEAKCLIAWLSFTLGMAGWAFPFVVFLDEAGLVGGATPRGTCMRG